MRTMLLTTAALCGFALALPAMAQTPNEPLPANPSSVKDGTPAAGTTNGTAPVTDPTSRTAIPGVAPTVPGGAAAGVSGGDPSNGATGAPNAMSNGQAASGQAEPAAGAPPDQSGTSQAGTSQPGSMADQSAPPAKPHHRMHHSMTASGAGDSGHWAHEPGTGESGPASMRASNIDSADTHSAIAPHLPTPKVGDNADPSRYLHDAERALQNHRSGEAQQALEMAETRLLDRSTPADSANQADQNPAIEQVTKARKALASGDMEGTRAAIRTALASADQGAGGGAMGQGGMNQGGQGANQGMGQGAGMSQQPQAGMSGPASGGQPQATPDGVSAESGAAAGAGTGGGNTSTAPASPDNSPK